MENFSSDANQSRPDGFLAQNCRETWPRWTCVLANVCGFCSTALWFIVLFPQLWKNFRRKSVRGLSVLWATSNFTASLINVFFVFLYASIPLYGRISSVYFPVMEFILLVQFWIYDRQRLAVKIAYACVCLLLWATVVTVILVYPLVHIAEYGAIFLWSAELFPQIILNMRLHTASGQAVGSVFIAMTGKTTDFVATNSLVMPLQYVLMRYFSTSVGYVNGVQVAWYYGNNRDLQSHDVKPNEVPQRNRREVNSADRSSPQSSEEIPLNENRPTTVQESKVHDQPRIVFLLRWLCMGTLSVLLLVFVVWFTWNIGSMFALFAPASIVFIVGGAKLYLFFCYKEHNAT